MYWFYRPMQCTARTLHAYAEFSTNQVSIRLKRSRIVTCQNGQTYRNSDEVALNTGVKYRTDMKIRYFGLNK